MGENEQVSRMMDHVLGILGSVTEELKEHKTIITVSDKNLALINQRLRSAEKMIERVEKLQHSYSLKNATKEGGDTVKWVIVSTIGGGVLTLFLQFLFTTFVT